jgi:hypothetical protein
MLAAPVTVPTVSSGMRSPFIVELLLAEQLANFLHFSQPVLLAAVARTKFLPSRFELALAFNAKSGFDCH